MCGRCDLSCHELEKTQSSQGKRKRRLNSSLACLRPEMWHYFPATSSAFSLRTSLMPCRSPETFLLMLLILNLWVIWGKSQMSLSNGHLSLWACRTATAQRVHRCCWTSPQCQASGCTLWNKCALSTETGKIINCKTHVFISLFSA